MAFFARKTLWKPGVASWWLDTVGTIPVDRDGGQDVSAIKRVLKALKEGKALILFPEGTRSPDGTLQSAKAGVGLLACKAQVPVIPARIFGSFEAYGKGVKIPRFGTPVSVVFGPALQPSGIRRRSRRQGALPDRQRAHHARRGCIGTAPSGGGLNRAAGKLRVVRKLRSLTRDRRPCARA
ncbi:MAG: 1-acyl-sn-glycerol-3-phosphate acyltransferase [Opitutus sp.]|nr:1-acyl-sn-glycerol-3-phosphate acyltransferase [Opitutus sp.]